MNKKLFEQLRSRKVRSRPRWANWAMYGGAMVILIVVAATGYRSPASSIIGQTTSQSTSTTQSNETVATISDAEAITYADETAAKIELAVAPSVSEQAVSVNVLSSIGSDATSANKTPGVGDDETDTSAPLASYTTVEGDDIASIAAKFGISDQTVRWANNLTGNDIGSAIELTIPIVDGVIYTVKDGDTLAAIAEKYKSDQEQIIAVNNLDGETLTTGAKLVLPNGVLPENERPGYRPPVSRPIVTRPITGGSSNGGRAPIPPRAAGNTFYYGNCTWYAYNRRIQMGRRMDGIRGNANAWDDTARAAGYLVNRTPAVGAIIQSNSGYYGHVGVVESINSDGTITISEMNNRAYGGFGIANYNRINNPYDYNYIH